MTDHYFENALVKLHYYKFGNGPQIMLCFHGYGMHGKQFKILEGTALASKYTFYGFDLFFHRLQIERRRFLHRRIFYGSRGQLTDLLLPMTLPPEAPSV